MHSHHRLNCVDGGGKRVYTLRPRRVESDAWMKRCPKCEQTLPLGLFCRNRRRRDGLQSWCRECGRKYKDKVGSSVLSRARKYRLKREEVAALLQVPACQCCGLPFVSESDMRFDHCHEGGHVRGVICQRCNVACSGHAIEAVSRLEDCKRYLLRDLEGQCEHARAS